MNKLKVIGLLVVFLVLVWTATAYAGGWWVEFGTGTGRTPAPSNFPQGDSSTTGHVQQWGNPNTSAGQGTPSPHGGFSTSTNLCKTCHAVHLANENSYRLLHDSSRLTECDWCHSTSQGRSSHRPYGEMFLKGRVVRGEHTLLTATKIPDSSVNRGIYGTEPAEIELHEKGRLPDRGVGDRRTSGNGLYCFDCHSVHGANIISSPDPAPGIEWIADPSNILRVDPAGNGGNVDTQGLKGIEEPGYKDTGLTDFAAEIASAFCGDCHNLNPNWTKADDIRDNLRSHPINTDGSLEVYHETIGVSWMNAESCMSCHSASWPAMTALSDFPHQSVGHKLLADGYTTAVPGAWGSPGGPHEADTLGESVGDPQRPLPAMDKVCITCHIDVGIEF